MCLLQVSLERKKRRKVSITFEGFVFRHPDTQTRGCEKHRSCIWKFFERRKGRKVERICIFEQTGQMAMPSYSPAEVALPVKGRWSLESSIYKWGVPVCRWATLSRHIKGRSENAIKNHWNSVNRCKVRSYSQTFRLQSFQSLDPPVSRFPSLRPSPFLNLLVFVHSTVRLAEIEILSCCIF